MPGILLGPDLCSYIFHDLCSGIFHDLCSLHGADLLLRLHGPHLFWGSLHYLCLGILYGPDLCLCLCIFLGRRSLELIQRGFGCWLTDVGMTLISSFKTGSNFVACRRLACIRRQGLSVGG